MILFIRFLFIVGCSVYGYTISSYSWYQSLSLPQAPWFGAVIGFVIGLLVIATDMLLKRYTVRNLLAILLGLGLGLLVHKLFVTVLVHANVADDILRPVSIASAVILSYLGIITIVRGQDEFSLVIPFVKLDTKGTGEELILLDTSVIIDGRVADICETHFLPGKLVLPRFVLKELQLIADSSDPLKRNRGRRGLDVLNRMKANPNVQIRINEMDFPEFSNLHYFYTFDCDLKTNRRCPLYREHPKRRL